MGDGPPHVALVGVGGALEEAVEPGALGRRRGAVTRSARVVAVAAVPGQAAKRARAQHRRQRQRDESRDQHRDRDGEPNGKPAMRAGRVHAESIAPARPRPAEFFAPNRDEEKKHEANEFEFYIRTLAEDKLIGELGLDVVNWVGRDAFVGLGIGETEYWSKGYGTDAMRLILQYAFTEANLQRVSLALHSYNERGLKSYEKAGFQLEGRSRGDQHREGKRTDTLWMGILREEWLGLDTQH